MKWLALKTPEILFDLSDGCQEEELEGFEAAIGKALPLDFRRLYSMHDGQKGGANAGPFYGLNFLTLAQCLHHWQEWKRIADEAERDGTMAGASRFCRSTPKGAIREVYASPDWIPFAYDYGGNFIGVDVGPELTGTYGQVINFGRDEDHKFVLGHSLGDFIRWMNDQLGVGNLVIHVEADGGRSLNTKDPAKGHFLDSVRLMFAEPEA